MKNQMPTEIPDARASDFPRREAASFNQRIEPMARSAITLLF
jgi:hypothetical protein